MRKIFGIWEKMRPHKQSMACQNEKGIQGAETKEFLINDCKIIQGDCLEWLSRNACTLKVHLTFLDPPFNQGKKYRYFNDSVPDNTYWNWIEQILRKIFEVTASGGSIYFMQREKNAEYVLRVLRRSGWKFQNLIIWKKLTSAVPTRCFSKSYQIIVFATKGKKPRVFNKLRIDYPLLPWQKYPRKNGVYLSDVWDDIRELTSGYYAGKEVLRENRARIHLQQSPVALLLRIILSSTKPGDLVLDPFAGTGTTLVVASQLKRKSIGIEIDPQYVKVIIERLTSLRPADNISRYRTYYRFTPKLEKIWPGV
jgi:DNA modification methylase